MKSGHDGKQDHLATPPLDLVCPMAESLVCEPKGYPRFQ
jgi:hypothetical protein